MLLSIRCLHFVTVHQVSPFLVVWILAEVCDISDKYYFCNNLTQGTWFPSLFSKKSCFSPSQKPLETFKAEISNQDQLNIGETVMTLSRNLLISILIHVTGQEILEANLLASISLLSWSLLVFKMISYYFIVFQNT